MTFRVPLQLAGIDVLSDEFDERVTPDLRDIFWTEVDGTPVAIVFADRDPVEKVCEVSHRIEHTFPGVRVLRVFEDFVGVSDIANRVGVTRETARNWVLGARGPGGFPMHRDTLGGGGSRGAQRIWTWADVNRWLVHVGLEDEFQYLSDLQAAKVNAYLARVDGALEKSWQVASKPDFNTQLFGTINVLLGQMHHDRAWSGVFHPSEGSESAKTTAGRKRDA